jgi:hypothetical protein
MGGPMNKKFLNEQLEIIKASSNAIEGFRTTYNGLDKNGKEYIDSKLSPVYHAKVWPNVKVNQNNQSNTLKKILPKLPLIDGEYAIKITNDSIIVEIPENQYKKNLIQAIKSEAMEYDLEFRKFFTFIYAKYNELQPKNNIFSFNINEFGKFIGKITGDKVKDNNALKKLKIRIERHIKNLMSITLKIWTIEGEIFIHPFNTISFDKRTMTIEINNFFANNLQKGFYELPLRAGLLRNTSFDIVNYLYNYSALNRKHCFNISIEALLKYTDLPTYEKVKTGSYKGEVTRWIKEPFEKAILDILGNIKDIDIRISGKKIPSTKIEFQNLNEVQNFSSYGVSYNKYIKTKLCIYISSHEGKFKTKKRKTKK